MKNVLLVYGYHQSGHYSAALAVKEELDARGYRADIQNIWVNKSEVIDKLFAIFRRFARNRNKNVPDFLGSQELLTHLANELPIDIDLERYDAIVSIHPYSSFVLAEEKKKKQLNNALIDVHTDYTPFPIVQHEFIDYHVGAIPTDNTSKALRKKIVATGIPIKSPFYSEESTKSDTILVMGGADGFGPLEKILLFLRGLSVDFEVSVFCGNNEDLYHQLLKDRRPNENIFPYVDDMVPYFKTGKFVVTKASGLTATESIATDCIPVFTPPVLFWEDESAKFLSSRGVGLYLPDYEQGSLESLELLLSSPEHQNLMIKRMQKMKRPNAAKGIVDLIESEPIVESNEMNQGNSDLVNDMRDYLGFFQSEHLNFKCTAVYLTEQIKRWLDNN